ncbi:hypothetical protein KV112_18735 [Mycolicibacter sp. MYC123]|uniref:ATP/GTP-binding protein n=1 Tax=[Mycobacterium] zoologicum TaxID=2872311 RepID=A0ABU5YNV1_9MYCO|nr:MULTISPECIES: hypothetical protein [unclassified Mycolicibacter]MEB3051752.1 hypothetical protein [Mycolicibacter sp. MYC123]MEB3065597.1 hypothetical protein [Mycolicibacter sp. MYC101]
MARRRSPSRPHQPLRLSANPQRVETGPDGYDYVVASIAGSRALKVYRCPGCDHEIRCGVAHVVTWRAESDASGEDRRHWHTPCWTNRATRGPTRKWS